MPYYQDPNKNKQGQDQGQGTVLGGGAAPETLGAGGAGAGSGQNQKTSSTTGSGFTNIDSYLKANQGSGFGGQLTGKVNDKIDTAKQNQNQAANTVNNQINQNTTSWGNIQGGVKSAIADPTKANAQDFQKNLNAEYKGPQGLADNQAAFNQFWSGTGAAKQQAGSLNSEQGRFGLLDTYFGRPNYTQGEKSLDNLVASRDQGFGQNAARAGREANAVERQGDKTSKNIQSAAQQGQQATSEARSNTRKAIGIDENGQVLRGEGAGAIGQGYDQAEANLKQRQGDEQKAIQNQVQNLQGSAANRNYDYGLDVSKYVGGPDLNLANTTSTDQSARLKALNDLAGTDYSTFMNSQEDLGKYSQGDIAPILDQNRYAQDLDTQRAAYNTDASKNAGQLDEYRKSLIGAQGNVALSPDQQRMLDMTMSMSKGQAPGSMAYQQAQQQAENERQEYLRQNTDARDKASYQNQDYLTQQARLDDELSKRYGGAKSGSTYKGALA